MRPTQVHQLFLLLTSCLLLSVNARAQKLPDNQESGIRAPAGLKIDGKAAEWGTLQAYSRTTQLSYTVANDNDNLYFVAQSDRPTITNKILAGGVTLIIYNQEKKKDNDAISVTFPTPVIKVNSAGGSSFAVGAPSVSPAPGLSAAEAKKKRDSVAYAYTTKRILNFKELKVKGIPAIADTLISMYNDEGIKARASYDENGIYTYELAIPLKYLELSVNDAKEFSYRVKLNGLEIPGVSLMQGNVTVVGNGSASSAMSDLQAMTSVTDFKGKYTLVK